MVDFLFGILCTGLQDVGLGQRCGCTAPIFLWFYYPLTSQGGEIDIFEGINEDSTNALSLKTVDGCTQPAGQKQLATLISTNCFINASGIDPVTKKQQNRQDGCRTETQSYGSQFNAAGGGTYTMLWDNNGINFWVFPRGKLPADIASGNPDPTKWGTPEYANVWTSCDRCKFYGNLFLTLDMKIVIDLYFCGVYAGEPSIWSKTCAAKTGFQTCKEYVATGKALADAYFSINYISVYSVSGSNGFTSTCPAAQAPLYPTTVITDAKGRDENGNPKKKSHSVRLDLGILAFTSLLFI